MSVSPRHAFGYGFAAASVAAALAGMVFTVNYSDYRPRSAALHAKQLLAPLQERIEIGLTAGSPVQALSLPPQLAQEFADIRISREGWIAAVTRRQGVVLVLVPERRPDGTFLW